MERKEKTPWIFSRGFHVILELLILALILIRFLAERHLPICEILIFLLAAVDNFLGATGAFSKKKRTLGNIYAILSTLFLILALLLIVLYIGIL